MAVIVLSLAILVLLVILYASHASTSRVRRDLTARLDEVNRNHAEQSLALVRRMEQEKDEERIRLQNRLDAANAELAEKKAEIGTLRERIANNEEAGKKMAEENEIRFRNLANEILETNSRRFKEQNEHRLNEILTPFKSELNDFRKAVQDAYSTESRERFSLQERIKELVEINRSIGREAKELTEALRGNSKVQGDWGEMILETLLEKSGLIRDVHFHTQLTTDSDGNVIHDESGRQLRPDVVVNYPDGRCVVIDSKVSLTAYVDMHNDPDNIEAHAARHMASVRKHIRELAAKNYQQYVGDKKTDFVMMFIPNEGAYIAAMNLDANLWQEAYDRRVLVISPTHLISVLKIVEQLWRQDDMQKNVLKIAEKSGLMYDKFVGFLDDMARIEKNLANLGASFADAKNKLSTGSGNLVRRAEELRRMGATAKKRIGSALVEASNDDGDDE